MAAPALAPILAALAPWITRFFMAKAVLLFAGFLGRLGLVLATNEILMEPALQALDNLWAAIPAKFHCWFGVFGITKMVSITVSALTIMAVQRVFFARAAS